MNNEIHQSTYQELVKRQYEMNVETHRILDELSGTSKTMQHILEAVNATLAVNTEALKNNEKYWGKIVWVMVVALCLLAGAEKIGQFIGN